jgi:hypothetical protein
LQTGCLAFWALETFGHLETIRSFPKKIGCFYEGNRRREMEEKQFLKKEKIGKK